MAELDLTEADIALLRALLRQEIDAYSHWVEYTLKDTDPVGKAYAEGLLQRLGGDDG